jgi:uracil-DNA glycosylase
LASRIEADNGGTDSIGNVSGFKRKFDQQIVRSMKHENDIPNRQGVDANDVPALPQSWLDVLGAEFAKPYFLELQRFIADERKQHQVFPLEPDIYRALLLTPCDRVRVVILGQDPYHNEGQAHGLCFSVQPPVPPPPSLKNIFRELKADLGCKPPNNGSLVPWAQQGVLLLNTVLTVRAHQAASHQKKGWEQFTDAVLRAVNANRQPTAFVLWGAHAQKKAELIDERRHLVIKSAHPSPLSANNGFFGSKPFSRINQFLKQNGCPEIEWQLPEV